MTARIARLQTLPSPSKFAGWIVIGIGLIAFIEQNYISGLMMIGGGSLQLPSVKQRIMKNNPKVSSNNLIFITTVLMFSACMGMLSDKDTSYLTSTSHSSSTEGSPTSKTHVSYRTGTSL